MIPIATYNTVTSPNSYWKIALIKWTKKPNIYEMPVVINTAINDLLYSNFSLNIFSNKNNIRAIIGQIRNDENKVVINTLHS